MEKYLSIEEHLKDGERSLIIHCESEKWLVLSNQNLIKLEMQIGSLNDISEYFEHILIEELNILSSFYFVNHLIYENT